MYKEEFSRTALLLGEDAIDRLAQCRVAVFGVGGVGGYVCEALARCGIGHLDLIDSDVVSISNINRQIIATHSSVGKYKTDVMKERILDINPEAEVHVFHCFFLPENADDFAFDQYDYVVDAVDTVTAKIALVEKCEKHQVPIICSMGAGNKLDASKFRVADIYQTKVCPLAKVMRRELKKRGISKCKVVYSEELPIKPGQEEAAVMQQEDIVRKKQVPGSVAFVPSVAGLIVAGEVVQDLIRIKA